MIYRAVNYAHDNYEDEEMVETLTDSGWPELVANRYVKSHNPGYEIGYEVLYDDIKNKVYVTRVEINGQIFTP